VFIIWGGGLVLGGRDYLIFSPAVRPQLYSSFNVIVARPCPSTMDGSLAHDIHIRSSRWLSNILSQKRRSVCLRFTKRFFANPSQSNLFEFGMIPQIETIINNYVTMLNKANVSWFWCNWWGQPVRYRFAQTQWFNDARRMVIHIE